MGTRIVRRYTSFGRRAGVDSLLKLLSGSNDRELAAIVARGAVRSPGNSRPPSLAAFAVRGRIAFVIDLDAYRPSRLFTQARELPHK